MSRTPSYNHTRGNSAGGQNTTYSPPTIPDIRRSTSSHASTATQMSLRGMRRLEARRTMEQAHFLAAKARAQNFNPAVDMRLLDYVAPYDGNLMCPICRCPFVDPVVLNECDHCFCRDCIRQTWSSSTYNPLGPRGDCPSCRTPAKLGPRSATSKILVNILDDLVVKCPKSDEGCPAEVKRGEVQDHVNIYCGYALVECAIDDCDLPVRRKDIAKGCLHQEVSCIDCRGEMLVYNLEKHWGSECPDRRISCKLCSDQVFFRELEDHNQHTCPAISIPCPGGDFGCTSRGRRQQSETHAKTCTFAKLAPMLSAQKQRLDEQEAAQKVMTKKLDVLQNGFAAMQSILYSPHDDPSSTEERHSPSTLNEPRRSSDTETNYNTHNHGFDFDFDSPSSALPNSTTHTAPTNPDPYPTDIHDPSLPTPNGPYSSPLHHLLSMHENLRTELSRMQTALAEAEGRHAMQTLNENLRTREEITYLGAQLAGLSRQVGWLTSAQLQRQQPRAGAGGSNVGSGNGGGGGVGESVEAAVRAVEGVVRGNHRMSTGGGQVLRRGLSEEGRTKL